MIWLMGPCCTLQKKSSSLSSCSGMALPQRSLILAAHPSFISASCTTRVLKKPDCWVHPSRMCSRPEPDTAFWSKKRWCSSNGSWYSTFLMARQTPAFSARCSIVNAFRANLFRNGTCKLQLSRHVLRYPILSSVFWRVPNSGPRSCLAF